MRSLFRWMSVTALASFLVVGCSENGGSVDDLFACSEEGIRDAIEQGGGPHRFDCKGPTTVVTEAQIVINNDVTLDGGGNLTIDANKEHRVIWVDPGTVAELRHMTVTGGRLTHEVAEENGAGIYNEGLLTLIETHVWRNEAAASGASGGGIFSKGDLTLTNSTLSENTAGSDQQWMLGSPKSTPPTSGGGILSTVGTTLTLVNSTVADNSAEHGGGIRSNGPITLINSTVSGNNAAEGGGVFHSVGEAAMTNTTISGNTAERRGGGIYDIAGHGTLALTNSTLWGNVASEGRAIWSYGPLSFGSTLIDGDCHGTPSLSSRGGNIESPGDTCGFNRANFASDTLKLGPLQDNGGPTLTHLPGPGSVAIDVIDRQRCVGSDGLPLGTDQRGVERPMGPSCDVGAVEAPSPCEGIDCEDEDQCTLNRCDPVDRTCSYPPDLDREPCDFDGAPGLCSAGVCVKDLCADDHCNDSNVCTTDFCDWIDGNCTNTAVEDGQSCTVDAGTGGASEGAGYCLEGVCVPDPCLGNPCDDDNLCTLDSCSPPDGTCSNIDRVDGTPCMDDLGQCVEGVCEVLPVCGAGRSIPETATTEVGHLRCDPGFATFPIGLDLKMAATPSTEIEQGENEFALQVEFAVDAQTVNLALSRNIGVIRVESIMATVDATMGDSNPTPVTVEEAPIPCTVTFEAGAPATFVSPRVDATWTLDIGQTLQLTLQDYEEVVVALGGSYFTLTTWGPEANCAWETEPPRVSFSLQP